MDKALEKKKKPKKPEEKAENVEESRQTSDVKAHHSFTEDLVQILANQERSQEINSSLWNVLENELQQVNAHDSGKAVSYGVTSEEPLKSDYGARVSSAQSYGEDYAKAAGSAGVMFYSSQEGSERNDYWEKREEEQEKIRRLIK